MDEGYHLTQELQQSSLYSPSVFNFFLLNHQPNGVIAIAPIGFIACVG